MIGQILWAAIHYLDTGRAGLGAAIAVVAPWMVGWPSS
jgi:uncharacterized membrane protein